MKVTRLGGPTYPTLGGLSGGGGTVTASQPPSGFVPTANGSNSWSWGSNVATITSNGSNQIIGPHVNFASGANIALSAASNTLTIIGLPQASSGGGGSVGITGYGQGFHVGDRLPLTAGTYDEEFEAAPADTLPSNWAWSGTTPTFYLNSRLPSWLYIDRTPSDTTTYTLRRSSFAPGTGAWGVWVRVITGGRGAGYLTNVEVWVTNSTGSEARSMQVRDSTTVRARANIASVDTDWSGGVAPTVPAGAYYLGLTKDASDRWRGFYSNDGISWVCVAGQGTNGTTHAFTADRFELRMAQGFSNAAPSRQGIDFLRFRSDNDFPRP